MASRRQETNEDSDIDKGWAWVIAIAGMVALFLSIGVARTQGMLMVELMSYYDASTTEVSYIVTWSGIGTMVSSLLFMFGLNDFIHERALVAGSGILNFIGFIVAYFSKSVAEVYVIGFCSGVAMQFAFVSSMSMAGKYFKKRLSIGCGLICAGVSCGILGLPPFIQWLFDEFTYRGASLIMAAITLNMVVSGILMRPKYPTRTTKTDASNKNDFGLLPIQSISKTTETPNQTDSEKAFGITNDGFEHIDCSEREMSVRKTYATDANSTANGKKRSDNEYSWQFIKSFVIKSIDTSEKKKSTSILKNTAYSMTFFKCPKFNMFLLFVYLSSTGSQAVVQFYPAITKELNMTSYQSAMLLSIVGGSDLIGRLLFGVLGDLKCVKRYVLMMIPQFVLCGSSLLCLRATEVWSQVIYAVVMGVCNCVIYSLRTVVMIELFGLPTLVRRMGVASFLTGIGLISSGPLFGYVRDETGDYNLPMQTLSALFFACGSTLLVIGLLRCCESRARQREISASR